MNYSPKKIWAAYKEMKVGEKYLQNQSNKSSSTSTINNQPSRYYDNVKRVAQAKVNIKGYKKTTSTYYDSYKQNLGVIK